MLADWILHTAKKINLFKVWVHLIEKSITFKFGAPGGIFCNQEGLC